MQEITYDAQTKMLGGFPKLRKLGAVSPNGEASPFIWKGRWMRLELEDPTRGVDPDYPTRAIIRDRQTGQVLSRFGEGCYYYSFYMEGDVAYVLGTRSMPESHDGDTILLYESRDLVNWSSRVLLTHPGWTYCNTALTKGPEGYVILMEAATPKSEVGIPYTFFFAKSRDLVNWEFLGREQSYNPNRYNGGPWMKYHNCWYYVISVTELPGPIYTNYISRTRDFTTWELGKYNPMLMPDEEDRRISELAFELSREHREEIKTGYLASNSDLDLWEHAGKTLITYNVGNQLGFYYLAEAEYDGPLGELLERYFY